MTQTALWPNRKPDICCKQCRFCAALAEPYERSDGAVIYGYCFKLGDTNQSHNMGKGFPIFIALDSGAACKDFKRRKKPEGEEDA